MKYSFLLLLTALLFTQCKKDDTEPELDDTVNETTITFDSEDDLTITADTYIAEANSEFILLCHQAGYSRGEYKDIALKLGAKGYNCMAIDQRSGNEVNGVVNETAKAASAAGLGTAYIDAEPDVKAAIDQAYELNGKKPIFVLGSSYSSSWAILLGKDNPKVKAVLGFSPRENLPGKDIKSSLTGYAKPVFLTSAQAEMLTVSNLVADMDTQYLTHFKSTKAGLHGARSLWDSAMGNEEYWAAMLGFLGAHK